VAGVLRRRSAAPRPSRPEIGFWEYLGPDRVQAATADASMATIRDLLECRRSSPTHRARVGKFAATI
jgi:hypothetical protein